MQNGISEVEFHQIQAMRFRDSILITILVLVVLWAVKTVELIFNYDFGQYGIYPRTLEGAIGIATGPLIHGDFNHLLSNTVPLLVLGVGVIYFYREIALNVFLLIYLLSGFWVWVAARDAFHIGASGIVYGLMFFLLVSGLIKRNRKQLAISLIIIFLYGSSMFTGMMPFDTGISYEAHITGAVSGIFCAVLYRKFIPAYEAFRNSWNNLREPEDLPQSINHTFTSDIDFHIVYKDKNSKDSVN